jgi:hypothetical protein
MRRTHRFVAPILGATLILFLASSCADRERMTSIPDDPQASWDLGPSSEHAVPTAPGSTVADSATGVVFHFPDGGSGALHVAPILSGPPAPYEGHGFSVEYAGEEVVQVLLDPDGPSRIYVFGYGMPEGAHNDPAGTPRWVTMPTVGTLDGKDVCLLTLPFGTAGAGLGSVAAPTIPRGARSPMASMAPTAPASALRFAEQPRGFSKYWISSIPVGATVTDTMLAIELQSSSFRDNLVSALTPARRTAAEAEINGRMNPNYAYDGNYYQGFWWRSLGAHGRLIHPTLHYRTRANAGNIAHELGHYFTHVLVGDDTWSILEGQAPLWDTGHGIRDVVGRGVLLEEYAYIPEFHLTGNVKGYNLFEPYDVFRSMTPLVTDYPSVEGFGAVILASLARPDDHVRDLITGRPVPAPVTNLPWSDLYEIVAQGATDIDALRGEIETRLGADANKLSAMLGRCGWTYSIRGRYVDASGGGVSGVTTTAVSRVGATTYEDGYTTLGSGADGSFSVVGGVFGGASELRAVKGPDTTFVAIHIDWTRPTSSSVEVGNLTVSFPPAITSLSVNSGRPGDAVTISGRNFGATQGGGSVSFNGAAAAVTSWSDEAISATVPEAARSGPVTVTRGAVTSNGIGFTVTGVGRWVFYEIEEDDWPAVGGTWCNFVDFQKQTNSFTLRCGYDNPYFEEQSWTDWETHVSGSWTIPPAELRAGEELVMTLTISTEFVLVDNPPTQSEASAGWTYLSANADDSSPPILNTNGTQVTTLHIRNVGYDPLVDRLVIRVTGGGYTGRIMRGYWYRWEQ